MNTKEKRMNIREIKARLHNLFTKTTATGRRCNQDCLGGHPHETDCALHHNHLGKCDSLQGAES